MTRSMDMPNYGYNIDYSYDDTYNKFLTSHGRNSIGGIKIIELIDTTE